MLVSFGNDLSNKSTSARNIDGDPPGLVLSFLTDLADTPLPDVSGPDRLTSSGIVRSGCENRHADGKKRS